MTTLTVKTNTGANRVFEFEEFDSQTNTSYFVNRDNAGSMQGWDRVSIKVKKAARNSLNPKGVHEVHVVFETPILETTSTTTAQTNAGYRPVDRVAYIPRVKSIFYIPDRTIAADRENLTAGIASLFDEAVNPGFALAIQNVVNFTS